MLRCTCGTSHTHITNQIEHSSARSVLHNTLCLCVSVLHGYSLSLVEVWSNRDKSLVNFYTGCTNLMFEWHELNSNIYFGCFLFISIYLFELFILQLKPHAITLRSILLFLYDATHIACSFTFHLRLVFLFLLCLFCCFPVSIIHCLSLSPSHSHFPFRHASLGFILFSSIAYNDFNLENWINILLLLATHNCTQGLIRQLTKKRNLAFYLFKQKKRRRQEAFVITFTCHTVPWINQPNTYAHTHTHDYPGWLWASDFFPLYKWFLHQ